MAVFDIESIRSASLKTDPFEYLVVPSFIGKPARDRINRSYPYINKPRNYRLDELEYGDEFKEFIQELVGPELRKAIGDKFGVDLDGKPTAITVRRYCEESDGNIHTDSKTKIITLLIYLNEEWPHDGGRLRLLRSANNIEDFTEEVVPVSGTLLAFKRSNHSFHGHKPYGGERRMVQLSWVEPKRVRNYRDKRNRLIWKFKRLLGISSGGRFRTN